MAKPVATVVHWGGDLSDDELASLSGVVAGDLPPRARAKIRTSYLSYVGGVAIQEASQPAKVLRQRLKVLAASAKEAALAIGADDRFFEEVGAYYASHRNSPPRGLTEETNSRVELELVHLDIRFRSKHAVDLGCADIELMKVAWQLAQIARASENAISELAKEKRGRPDSGAKRFVGALIDALLDADVSVTCWYSDIDAAYHGSFPMIAQWFRQLPQPLRESESTLCKIAVRCLAQRNKDQNGSTADN